MDDVLDYTSNVSMSLGVVECSELGRGFVETCVGRYEVVSDTISSSLFAVLSCSVECNILKIEPRPFL